MAAACPARRALPNCLAGPLAQPDTGSVQQVISNVPPLCGCAVRGGAASSRNQGHVPAHAAVRCRHQRRCPATGRRWDRSAGGGTWSIPAAAPPPCIQTEMDSPHKENLFPTLCVARRRETAAVLAMPTVALIAIAFHRPLTHRVCRSKPLKMASCSAVGRWRRLAARREPSLPSCMIGETVKLPCADQRRICMGGPPPCGTNSAVLSGGCTAWGHASDRLTSWCHTAAHQCGREDV